MSSITLSNGLSNLTTKIIMNVYNSSLICKFHKSRIQNLENENCDKLSTSVSKL